MIFRSKTATSRGIQVTVISKLVNINKKLSKEHKTNLAWRGNRTSKNPNILIN